MAQWQAKQALDMGCYGIVFPHISTVEEAANAVGACRYPRMKNAPLYEPAGIRGDGPTAAARYWGIGQQEYYQKADVWPLNPQGEIFCILQIEDTRGVENLDDMLKNVPGIGAILIGEGDLSQELGYPRQYEHKVVLEWMKRIVDTCKKHNVVVGHPHVESRQRRAHRQGRLPLPDDGAGAELRPFHGGAKSHRPELDADEDRALPRRIWAAWAAPSRRGSPIRASTTIGWDRDAVAMKRRRRRTAWRSRRIPAPSPTAPTHGDLDHHRRSRRAEYLSRQGRISSPATCAASCSST